MVSRSSSSSSGLSLANCSSSSSKPKKIVTTLHRQHSTTCHAAFCTGSFRGFQASSCTWGRSGAVIP
jgi:hypothetical protein